MKHLKATAAILTAAIIGMAGTALASEGETFKLGAFLQLTGSNSVAGIESKQTIEMLLEDINADGGFNGKQVELVVYDSQGSPEEATKIASKLINDDKVDAIIGSVNSSEILAAGSTINDAGVFMMGLGTAATWMLEDWPYVWRATPNNGNLATQTVKMLGVGGYTNTVIFNGQDDASLSTADEFERLCGENGIEVLGRETYDAGDTDFHAQIAKLLSYDPECFYMTTSGADIGAFVKQLRQSGYKGVLFSKEVMSMRDAEIAGDENAWYTAAAYPYVVYGNIDDVDDEQTKALLQQYLDTYGEMPQTECPYRVYDTLNVMWEATKIAGANDSDSLVAAMPQVEVDGIAGDLTYTDGTREGIHDSHYFIYVGNGLNKDFEKWLEEDFDAYKEATGREK